MPTRTSSWSLRAVLSALVGVAFAAGCSAAPTEGAPPEESASTESAALFSPCGPLPPVAMCLRPVCLPGDHTWTIEPAPAGTRCGGAARVCDGHAHCVTIEPPVPFAFDAGPVLLEGDEPAQP